ncbi:glycolate oxidase subunit GlcE [Halomonas cupida]|uniref:glycolate oxidase subunit GlcE n=1 Tax=Halomonas cupida TaxID=44933 RepID=UPI003A91A072
MSVTAPSMAPHDDLANLAERLQQADRDGSAIRIEGGGTRYFTGRQVTGEVLSTRQHRGITSYDPVELIVSVRSGTLLQELEASLAEQGQMLPFEPPRLGEQGTVGGMVASGLSGPRRPWAGAVRDFVLGMRVLDHQGREQRFGGEVMKNVAGYDLSRLMVGAQGSLGLITEVSLKVLPIAGTSRSLRLEMSRDQAMQKLSVWGRKPLPLSGATWHDGALHLRLEGGPGSVTDTAAMIGGDRLDDRYWQQLRDWQLPLFSRESLHTDPRPLWRLSLPAQTPPLPLPELEDAIQIDDWAGCQRWLRTDIDATTLREACTRAGGHATCFTPGHTTPFTPLASAVARYHRQLKQQLDPRGIFNPGRLYPDL